ncbi:unnamed protein product [Gongylonema pulchrum]|uniref:DM10 domain-containing protein n=1 Tax=Gongylonema pulchrum TaxID=637853 RepID=A0A183EXI9_9BILA|nr:unnamed protein product [Gongylonema pulchrum]
MTYQVLLHATNKPRAVASTVFFLKIGKATGRLHNFIVEPFCEHSDADEMYIAIYSRREHDIILFYERGGIDVGDIDAKVCSGRFDFITT